MKTMTKYIEIYSNSLLETYMNFPLSNKYKDHKYVEKYSQKQKV